MRVVNYKQGYNNTFDCSIHGTIKMSRDEYNQALNFLLTNHLEDYLLKVNLSVPNDLKFWKNVLIDDLNKREYVKSSNGKIEKFRLNVRIKMTNYIVWYFMPTNAVNYKLGNYQLEVRV